MIVHAGLIARYGQGGWAGVLIEGPSGSGKSDLALRATNAGFRLVADDRTHVFASAGRVFGRAPAPLKGLIEARGLGVVPRPVLDLAQIVLIVRCLAPPAAPDRHPDRAYKTIADVRLPSLALAALETSALDKLIAAIEHLGGRR